MKQTSSSTNTTNIIHGILSNLQGGGYIISTTPHPQETLKPTTERLSSHPLEILRLYFRGQDVATTITCSVPRKLPILLQGDFTIIIPPQGMEACRTRAAQE